MKYLLDTNTASDLFNKTSKHYQRLVNKLRELQEDDSLHISILTLYELEYGLEYAPEILRPELHTKIEQIKQHTHLLLLDENGIGYFGKLKANFRKQENLKKEDVGEFSIDLLLASTALSENATLVSADKIFPNLAEINPKLHFENWTI